MNMNGKSCGFWMACLLMVCAFQASANTEWAQIDASQPFVDDRGVFRRPMCSGGPQLTQTPTGPKLVSAPEAYSFFFRAGDPNKLAIIWDGGGACWDANTCIGSALLDAHVYTLAVDETVAQLEGIGGLADIDNPENPIAGYTQVFIPYCTADLHFGAADTLYRFTARDGTTIPWLIHHHGSDNVAAVLHWLKNHYRDQIGHLPDEAFLVGASAGGYGVLYSYPEVAAWLPETTRTRLWVDAANGIINKDFFDRALTPDGVWRAHDNLAPQLTDAFTGAPEELIVRMFKGLGSDFPLTRFGHYTTAFDGTQISFFNIARHIESPELWLDPAEIIRAGLEWTLRARSDMLRTALQTPNYRFYIGEGFDHAIVDEDKLYQENSAQGVAFIDWLDDLIHRPFSLGGAWRNLSCAPNCLP